MSKETLSFKDYTGTKVTADFFKWDVGGYDEFFIGIARHEDEEDDERVMVLTKRQALKLAYLLFKFAMRKR